MVEARITAAARGRVLPAEKVPERIVAEELFEDVSGILEAEARSEARLVEVVIEHSAAVSSLLRRAESFALVVRTLLLLYKSRHRALAAVKIRSAGH